MATYRKFKSNVSRTLEEAFSKEEEIAEKLLDIDISQLYQFIRLFKTALRKYIVWKKSNFIIDEFIKKCRVKRFRQAQELGWEYYFTNGGYEANSHFLFGKASQFRLNSS